jgi:hypothetical protein
VIRCRTTGAALVLTCLVSIAAAETFEGWQGLRVIRQGGWPIAARHADLDADGREELILVNVRQSRLEIYRWLPADQREEAQATDPERPNELPMALDFKRDEIALERLPRDVMAVNLDDDKALELVVLETPPNRVVTYDYQDGKWQQGTKWDLLAGNLMGIDHLMLVSPTSGKGALELLISFEDGIQSLTLTEDARARWMQPREKQGRIAWWSADFDRDGDRDLVEWTRTDGESIRWYENTGSSLLPARGVSDIKADDAAMLFDKKGQAEVLMLGGLQRGVLRRYNMSVDAASPFGLHQPLPLGAGRVTWAGVTVNGKAELATIEGDQPRLTLHELTDAGWAVGQTYPVVSNVQNLVAPKGAPGTLLMWAKDASDLHISRFENGRFTFPRPYTSHLPDDANPMREVLALGTAGETVWWAQKVADKHIDLFIWPGDQDSPTLKRFADAGKKADTVNWLGGDQLLVMEKFARSPKLMVATDDGKAKVSEPSHLAKAKLSDFTLLPWQGELRLARIENGVLQWLDSNLQPLDQVMLPDSQRLLAFVEHTHDGKDGALVLESGGKKLHFMTSDDAGVMRVADTFPAPGGSVLMHDPVIGLVMAGGGRMVRLDEGRPRMLELVDQLDSRVGRPSGVKEATIHRVGTVDITGDGNDEVLIADDRRHQLTALRPTADGLKPIISWPVFEDTAYPYGGMEEDTVSEPRIVVGLDFDGDGKQDLAMVCHDRLLIYLGQDTTKGGE